MQYETRKQMEKVLSRKVSEASDRRSLRLQGEAPRIVKLTASKPVQCESVSDFLSKLETRFGNKG